MQKNSVELPPYCYTVSPYTGATLRIIRGENAYFARRRGLPAAQTGGADRLTKAICKTERRLTDEDRRPQGPGPDR